MPFKVTDLCIVQDGAPRKHEMIIDGRKRSYTFEYNTPLEMPEAEARKFVPIVEGFEVLDEAGNRILPTIPVTQGYGDKVALEEDQCIARFSELSVPALLNRAWVMPGGEHFKGNAKKDDVIAFIMKTRLAQAKARLGKSDAEPDEMSEAELAEMARMAA